MTGMICWAEGKTYGKLTKRNKFQWKRKEIYIKFKWRQSKRKKTLLCSSHRLCGTYTYTIHFHSIFFSFYSNKIYVFDINLLKLYFKIFHNFRGVQFYFISHTIFSLFLHIASPRSTAASDVFTLFSYFLNFPDSMLLFWRKVSTSLTFTTFIHKCILKRTLTWSQGGGGTMIEWMDERWTNVYTSAPHQEITYEHYSSRRCEFYNFRWNEI